jgi:hypothetical protein
MVAVSTLKIIFLVILALALFRLVRILIQKEKESVLRALIICAILGAILYGLTTVKTEKVSLSIGQLKRLIFPSKAQDWEFIKEEGVRQGLPVTRYIFPEPGPRLNLTIDPAGNTFSIVDVGPVNAVLEYLGLPPVEEGVPELSSITGSTLNINTYRWDDYPRGILVIERGLCRNIDNLETYHCITNLTIRARG